MQRPKRVEFLAHPAEAARLDAAAAAVNLDRSGLIRTRLHDILKGGASPIELLRAWYFTTLRQDLTEQIAFLDTEIAQVEALVHDREPGSIVRGWLNETLARHIARRDALRMKLDHLTPKGPA